MKIKIIYVYSIIYLIYIVGCSENNIENVVDPSVQNIEFDNIISSEPDSIRTLKSLKREGDLFMITYYGDYNSLLEELNERIINYGIGSVIAPGGANHECSIFSALGDSALPIFGRNLDNSVARGVLVGLYTPSD